MTEDRLKEVMQVAQFEFWKVVADELNDCMTGDFDAAAQNTFNLHCMNAVRGWYESNKPDTRTEDFMKLLSPSVETGISTWKWKVDRDGSIYWYSDYHGLDAVIRATPFFEGEDLTPWCIDLGDERIPMKDTESTKIAYLKRLHVCINFAEELT